MNDIEGTILDNRQVIPHCRLIRIKLSKPLGRVIPGQFVMIKVPDREIFLRRPFSIYDCTGKTISIMYKVVGAGTESLSRAKKGDGTSVLGPLGKGFSVKRGGRPVVIAGGIGIAGVHMLIKRLGDRAYVFYGCATGEEKVLLMNQGNTPDTNTYITTLDGSSGTRGTVVDLLGEKLEGLLPAEIFACGPVGMLRSLKELLAQRKTPCQALLEERMACGLGLCFGCVIKTIDEKEPYKRVCKEGPVFSLWEISL